VSSVSASVVKHSLEDKVVQAETMEAFGRVPHPDGGLGNTAATTNAYIHQAYEEACSLPVPS